MPGRSENSVKHAVVVEPTHDRAAADSPGDARAQQSKLESEFRPKETIYSAESARQDNDGKSSSVRSKLWKSCLAILCLALLVSMPSFRLFSTTSTEAVINARVITLRTPIAGVVEAPTSRLHVGKPLAPEGVLLKVRNPRADRSRLDDLKRQISSLETDMQTLDKRIAASENYRNQLLVQTHVFQSFRKRQLEARVKELRAEVDQYLARRDHANAQLSRAQTLSRKGITSQAKLSEVRRDEKVSGGQVAALKHRLQQNAVALEAATKGVWLTDSHHGRPNSTNRADELGFTLDRLRAQQEGNRIRVTLLKSELAREEKKFALNSDVDITSPVQGRVWEVLTSPGESVIAGQETVRILDCGGVVVTASVSEVVYNSVSIGAVAYFQPRGKTVEYQGEVIGVSGLAAAPSNFAIRPSSLALEPYRVTVSIPDLPEAPACNVGRSGVVTFNRDATGRS